MTYFVNAKERILSLFCVIILNTLKQCAALSELVGIVLK